MKKNILREFTIKNFFATNPNVSYSINGQIRSSYIIIISVMLLPIIFSLLVSITDTFRYDRIITNVSRANTLNQTVKTNITDEVWDIVAGKKQFVEGSQYIILENIKKEIIQIMQDAKGGRNFEMLEIAMRAVQTLERNIDRLGVQIADGASVSDTEATLEDVRGISSLVYDILQDFIVAEIEAASITNSNIKRTSFVLSIMQVLVAISVTFFAYRTLVSVSHRIRRPIYELEQLSASIASGNLEVRAHGTNIAELVHLTENLNIMAEKIKELIDTNIREQQNLKKAEMKMLQAQITPHFLYNTLDTIVWLAEADKTQSVIEITRALSRFFRIALSRGHEWITVAQEMEHVESYLFIQKIRYRDVLDYEIKYDAEIAEKPMLKLILQPLVENAIYHGIKNKRGRGKLSIEGHQNGNIMLFTISDTGIGMTQERLMQVQSEINGTEKTEELSSVYGLYNVNQRLKLYYNSEIIFQVDSVYGEGTKISLQVPIDGAKELNGMNTIHLEK